MNAKEIGRIRRHIKIRKKLRGTAERPRLAVRRSLNNLYAQLINDVSETTVFSFSTADKTFTKTAAGLSKSEAAAKLGELYAPKIKEKGISKVAFDRSGYKYHGRIKALADALREKGIQF